MNESELLQLLRFTLQLLSPINMNPINMNGSKLLQLLRI